MYWKILFNKFTSRCTKSKLDVPPEPLISILQNSGECAFFGTSTAKGYPYFFNTLRQFVVFNPKSFVSCFLLSLPGRKHILFTDVIHFYLTSRRRALLLNHLSGRKSGACQNVLIPASCIHHIVIFACALPLRTREGVVTLSPMRAVYTNQDSVH